MNDLVPAIGSSARWYRADGTPCYEVPYKDSKRKGETRPPTVKDGRELGLFPSVTTIIATLAKPGLVQWQLGHMLRAALTLPRIDGESEDDYAARVIQDYEAYPAEARDTGSAIHAAISSWLRGGNFRAEPEIWPVMESWLLWYKAQEFAHEATERAVIDLEHGYAGTLDWVGTWNGKRTYIDFKTVDKEPVFYPEWPIQIAAYAKADGHIEDSQLVSVAISRNQPGVIGVKVWKDNLTHWGRFHALLNYWRLTFHWGVEE